MPPKGEVGYDSRAPSAYGDPYSRSVYDQPLSRGISPSASQQNLRPRASFYENKSQYGGGGPGSVFGDARSVHTGYAPAPVPPFNPFYNQAEMRGSSYSLTQLPLDHRGSTYSLTGGNAGPPLGWSQSRLSSYSIAPQGSAPPPAAPQSRPTSNFLGDLDSGAPLSAGAQSITDGQLESSIRRICKNADLDTLTKKGVRKQLEEEYSVGLTERKEAINRIIEKVLNGESASPACEALAESQIDPSRSHTIHCT